MDPRSRLAKLFGMLGSDNAQERKSALARLQEIMRQTGKAFDTLTDDDLTRLEASENAAQWRFDDKQPPEPEPVFDENQTNALGLVHHVLREYSDVKPHEYVGTALWTLHTHVWERFLIAPRLALLSPFRGCGKTELLSLLAKLVADPEKHDNITAAALFRANDARAPCWLLDEGENLAMRLNRDLKAVLDSGHRRGGVITRCINGADRSFQTYSRMAIAAIGPLPLTLAHRAVIIRMMRTLRTDLKKLDGDISRLDALQRYLVTWGRNVGTFDLNPKLPKVLHGRANDNWRVLISIADSFKSQYWSRMAREAAIAFAADSQLAEDPLVLVLIDLRTVFHLHGVDRMFSENIIKELIALEDGAGIWSAWRGDRDDQTPHHLTRGELAGLLSRLDIRPKTVWPLGGRLDRGSSAKGYYKHQFLDAWARLRIEEPKDENDVRQLRRK